MATTTGTPGDIGYKTTIEEAVEEGGGNSTGIHVQWEETVNDEEVRRQQQQQEEEQKRIRPGLIPSLSSSSFANKSIRHVVTVRERRFDIGTLPADMQRVYGHLEEQSGEEYALIFIFMMRTAIELHRAWNMTLLTSKVLQQIKDKFEMRTTWNLGVLRLIFRVEDGMFELQRKVPYDYDSEFQDIYMRIALALVEGHINVHEALIFQTEAKHGTHTAKSGLFLRRWPGRLLLYPFESATCAIIFFSGDFRDAAAACATGFAAGLIEMFLQNVGGQAGVLLDCFVGISTGIIGGLFYKFDGQQYCLSSIFLGTLYWFFYGTAFVIGLLEIIAGELQTGVTRIMAVSIKTFVLCLGACFGMVIVFENSGEIWREQSSQCSLINLDVEWWRIPMYLLCSVSVLGQYRFPVVHYWRGLIVQLAGYEVQYQSYKFFHTNSTSDFVDTAMSNVLGDMAAVVSASILSYVVDNMGYYYNAAVLDRDQDNYSSFGNFLFHFQAFFVSCGNWIGIGRRTDLESLRLLRRLKKQRKELRDPNHPRTEITLSPQEETMLIEALVSAESISIWSVLMPAVYQLVPGSIIAKLWFSIIYPPPVTEPQDNIFFNLMVISASLALGLLLGFALVQVLEKIFCFWTHQNTDGNERKKHNERTRKRQSIMGLVPEDDPSFDNFDDNNSPTNQAKVD